MKRSRNGSGKGGGVAGFGVAPYCMESIGPSRVASVHCGVRPAAPSLRSRFVLVCFVFVFFPSWQQVVREEVPGRDISMIVSRGVCIFSFFFLFLYQEWKNIVVCLGSR